MHGPPERFRVIDKSRRGSHGIAVALEVKVSLNGNHDYFGSWRCDLPEPAPPGQCRSPDGCAKPRDGESSYFQVHRMRYCLTVPMRAGRKPRGMPAAATG